MKMLDSNQTLDLAGGPVETVNVPAGLCSWMWLAENFHKHVTS